MKKNSILLLILTVIFSNLIFSQENIIIHNLSENEFNLNYLDINGRIKDNLPLCFNQHNKNKQTGKLILSFSTRNQEKINLSWTNTSLGTKAKYSINVKYRIGDSGKWINLCDNRNRQISFNSTRKKNSKSFRNILLPEECNDKELIQICWDINFLAGKGKYPDFKLINLSLSSDNDPFNGKAPELFVRLKTDQGTKEIDKIDFNHIPIPYTYPQTIRINLSGKYLRDDVVLKIKGKDAEYFNLDKNKLSIDSLSNKNVSITYSPNKIGEHNAELVISTKKLEPISLKLYASCAKAIKPGDNIIPEDVNKITNNTSFDINIFSQSEYQFRFDYNIKDFGDKDYIITYEWFNGKKRLFEMEDYINNISELDFKGKNHIVQYCVPLSSPANADRLKISITTDDEGLKISNLYFGTPKLKRLIASGNWNSPDAWSPVGVPNVEDFVFISPNTEVKVDDDVVCSMLILGDSSKIEINTGKMFYVSGDIVYGKNSWFIVHQDLLPKKWHYISSPINEAKALIYSMRKDSNETWLMKYNTGQKSKLGDYWSEYIMDPKYSLVPAQGYAVYTHQPLDVIYEGILNKSSVTIPLTNTEKDRWNLIGNPYTAPLSSKKLFNDIDGKIQGNAIFLLDSKNGVYNPIIIDNREEVIIPSLESFFVEALKTNTEITFKRNHQYIPRSSNHTWTNHNYLTLSINKSDASQYVLMGMLNDAKIDYDDYDAHKMFGSNEDMPEIYFIVNKEELAINVFPDYPAIYDIGYYFAKEHNNVSMSIGNLSVIPDNITIFLEDKESGQYHNLCDHATINIKGEKGANDDNYRIHLIKALPLVGINNEYSGIYAWSDGSKINIFGDNFHQLTSFRVYNSSNQLIKEDKYNNEIVTIKNLDKNKYYLDIEVNGIWLRGFLLEIK